MANYISVLTLRCAPELREQALAQFMERQVLETCRDAVPGFVSGRLLRARDDAGSACVICEWTDQAAFEQWMSSPRRNAPAPDKLFQASGRSALFELVQQLDR